ncbi:MAG TPA: anti-sigma factor [Longimicrobiaceae bacterium]
MSEARACRTLREGLTEYLENALPPSRRQGMELHLAACAPCRAFLEQVRCTIHSTGGLGGQPMPPKIRTALLRALREDDSG